MLSTSLCVIAELYFFVFCLCWSAVLSKVASKPAVMHCTAGVSTDVEATKLCAAEIESSELYVTMGTNWQCAVWVCVYIVNSIVAAMTS